MVMAAMDLEDISLKVHIYINITITLSNKFSLFLIREM